MANVFVPIYEKDGSKFFIIQSDFVGKNEEEARQIGLGSMLVECVLLDMEYTGQVKEIDTQNTPHRAARLVGYKVGVIEGPLFEEAQAKVS